MDWRKKIGEHKFNKKALEIEDHIKQALNEFPHYGEVCQRLMEVGDESFRLLNTCRVRVGVPIKSMLAKPLHKLELADHLARFGE